jgi:hypothetical protein
MEEQDKGAEPEGAEKDDRPREGFAEDTHQAADEPAAERPTYEPIGEMHGPAADTAERPEADDMPAPEVGESPASTADLRTQEGVDEPTQVPEGQVVGASREARPVISGRGLAAGVAAVLAAFAFGGIGYAIGASSSSSAFHGPGIAAIQNNRVPPNASFQFPANGNSSGVR